MEHLLLLGEGGSEPLPDLLRHGLADQLGQVILHTLPGTQDSQRPSMGSFHLTLVFLTLFVFNFLVSIPS